MWPSNNVFFKMIIFNIVTCFRKCIFVSHLRRKLPIVKWFTRMFIWTWHYDYWVLENIYSSVYRKCFLRQNVLQYCLWIIYTICIKVLQPNNRCLYSSIRTTLALWFDVKWTKCTLTFSKQCISYQYAF